ncbi:hypothetical protein [Aquimarina intermedia]|uniref:Uncharacterized protein n=1 Tax=Aquimarina intermedia TaxID=350814 RepID=A0A5S5BX09_9FLAO|nr:hypothetical protein [Aquimarina intermedia]TYP71509.1 hypothetical protein BD809_10991 [Aquimarina intermedia]
MKLIEKENTGIDLVEKIMSKQISIPKMEMSLTMQDVFEKPLIRSVFKGENSQLGFTFINGMVKRFTDSFGFSSKLSPSQIEMLTVDTLEKCAYESLEDVILFFKMARSGSFGTTTRGLDSNLIFGTWFPKYLELKADYREQSYQNEKSKLNSISVTYEDVQITYKKNTEKKKLEKIKRHIDGITKNMDRQMLEDTITDWQKDPIKKPYVRLLKAKRKSIK